MFYDCEIMSKNKFEIAIFVMSFLLQLLDSYFIEIPFRKPKLFWRLILETTFLFCQTRKKKN